MQGGAGDTEGANGRRTRCAHLFFMFLLFTDCPLQLPHLPNMKNVTHSRIFRVRWLSCPSPCPQQPNTKVCPCGHGLHAGLLFPLSCTLTTPRTRKTHKTRMFFMSSGSPAPALVPCNPTQRTCPCGHILCARLPPQPYLPPPPTTPRTQKTRACRMFSCLAALIPQPSSPTRKSCRFSC